MAKPKAWTCNACAHEGRTSREHLIHVAIGRVILRNRGLSPDEVRAHLRGDYFRDFGYYSNPSEGERIGPAWMDQQLRGLICQTCNNRWARRLEEDAGNNLYDFTILRGTADAAVLRRWAWYFATKLWFAGHRLEGISDGPLLPLLRTLADPSGSVAMAVRVGRLTLSPRDWRFAGLAKGWAAGPTPYIAWIIRGVVWMVVASDGRMTLPVPTTEVVDGLRLHQVATINKRLLPALFSAPPFDWGRVTDRRARA